MKTFIYKCCCRPVNRSSIRSIVSLTDNALAVGGCFLVAYYVIVFSQSVIVTRDKTIGRFSQPPKYRS